MILDIVSRPYIMLKSRNRRQGVVADEVMSLMSQQGRVWWRSRVAGSRLL